MTPSDRAKDSALKAWVRALEATTPLARERTATLPVRIERLAAEYGDRVALIGEDSTLTYRELADRAAQYTGWAIDEGFAAGDVICLVMHNCPDYLAAWLGVTRIGAVVALVNTNLVGDSLAHAIRVAGPKAVIAGADLADAVHSIAGQLDASIRFWVTGGSIKGFASLDDALSSHAGREIRASTLQAPSLNERALLIYTSGTTGLPKAANVSHHRVLQWSYWFAGLLDTGPDDRMYDCLPMYHSVGGVVAIGAALVNGGSVVLRRKFSSRAFWDDIVATECTLFQYIGELCRFLVNAPPNPLERAHKLRAACGNGLRPDVWPEFQQRFAIPKILEFYAATEANFSLYNWEGRVGAIGRIPSFLAHRFPVVLVAFDVDSGEPVRDDTGRCRRCGPDEIGEAISRIAEGSAEGRFEGYTDRAASERKVLRDVFEPGDAWFRSGDLMRRDSAGFYYFVDRVGDTFRWKGENVSTTEVAEAVSAWSHVQEAVVYGVEVPGAEGRAGMAAVVADAEFDVDGFHAYLANALPEYARPLFLRVMPAIATTGTFKPVKQELVRAAFDPAATSDPLYVHDRQAGRFVRILPEVYERIRSGGLRL
ncbi:MAG TPA: long-chain-acyl-CoA synthetase [Gemmatimonadaceae bacterium]|nr:long-chain-acyl-CoA synthetase [Gemmatimonadaceae bacterium]